ncbi:MAG: outer membrane beta-barrel protein, partial [Saprospiraceae bacterium]
MKNAIIFYCLVLTTLSAQESKNNFNLLLHSGIGINKLLKKDNSRNPSIPTNSNFGLNFSIGPMIEYNKFSKMQFAVGMEYKLNQLHTKISGIRTEESIIKGWPPVDILQAYTMNYLSIPIL